VTLSPLPCWDDPPPESLKKCIAEIAEEIDAEAEPGGRRWPSLRMGGTF
jgi:hypothetical protein